MMENPERLLRAAVEARDMAYAPYSGYRVGAAVEDERGKVYSGCNVENASYGAAVCAERSAIFAMIREGGRQIKAVAVATENGGVPCGICLQVICEFAAAPEHVMIFCANDAGEFKTYTLREMLPLEFRLPGERK